MRRIAIFLGLVALAGCVTKPPRADKIVAVPSDRLLAFQTPISGGAEVVVTRDVGFAGGGCYAAFFVDGQVAAKLATGERASFAIPAGDHVLGTWNTGSGLCGFREGKDRKEVSATLKAGETRKYRITINPNSGVELNATTL